MNRILGLVRSVSALIGLLVGHVPPVSILSRADCKVKFIEWYYSELAIFYKCCLLCMQIAALCCHLWAQISQIAISHEVAYFISRLLFCLGKPAYIQCDLSH